MKLEEQTLGTPCKVQSMMEIMHSEWTFIIIINLYIYTKSYHFTWSS